MKLKFKQIKRQKEGLFGGSKPGYSYQLVFMLSLEAEELQVIKDHQMHDYVLFEGKNSRITTNSLLGYPYQSQGEWVVAGRVVDLKDMLVLWNEETGIMEATRHLDFMIRYLGSFGVEEYEYSVDELRGGEAEPSTNSEDFQDGQRMKQIIAAGMVYGISQRAEMNEQIGNIAENTGSDGGFGG